VTDLFALPKCPVGKKGRHRGRSWMTCDDNGSDPHFVWECRACGMARFAGSEAFSPIPVDDLSAHEIERLVRGL
jgi:hypothetical protein